MRKVTIIGGLILVVLMSVLLIGCGEGGAPAPEIPGESGGNGGADELATKQAQQEQAQDAALSAFETTQAKSSEGADATEEPAGEMKDGATILEESCTQCHSLDRVYNADYDADGWRDNIDRMVSKGAVISDEDAEILIEFLLAQE